MHFFLSFLSFIHNKRDFSTMTETLFKVRNDRVFDALQIQEPIPLARDIDFPTGTKKQPLRVADFGVTQIGSTETYLRNKFSQCFSFLLIKKKNTVLQ